MTEFFHVITADQFTELLIRFPRLSSEKIPLDASLARILSDDIVAFEDLPEQARSTVDGYAVRAEDTFGASDSIPALLEIAEPVQMGTIPGYALNSGQAAPIPTGGFLPRGADAVVMVEYTNRADEKNVEITRPVTLRTNVLDKGEDSKSGEPLLPSGMQLRFQDIGFLAAAGFSEVSVYRKPKVAILSSGDEVVPVDCRPRPGQIRDANSHALAALVREAGAEPILFEIVPDNAAMLRQALETALSQSDITAISGGSSVGARDLMKSAVSSLNDTEILAHGIAIRPGKPTLLADRKGKAIFGLPGHPVSALIVAQVFLVPLLRHLQGAALGKGPRGLRIDATLTASIHSTIGLEEYVRVVIEEKPDGTYEAHPVYGKSGMLSTMVKANGILVIPMNVEGLSKGDSVQVVQW
ncbi:MAG: molybdopterin molybdotransferase MoeA [Acidobacteria bacterium]|nr:molybdopterin molybdotransferase MoeA [Acidobacteriota bacterium]